MLLWRANPQCKQSCKTAVQLEPGTLPVVFSRKVKAVRLLAILRDQKTRSGCMIMLSCPCPKWPQLHFLKGQYTYQ